MAIQSRKQKWNCKNQRKKVEVLQISEFWQPRQELNVAVAIFIDKQIHPPSQLEN